MFAFLPVCVAATRWMGSKKCPVWLNGGVVKEPCPLSGNGRPIVLNYDPDAETFDIAEYEVALLTFGAAARPLVQALQSLHEPDVTTVGAWDLLRILAKFYDFEHHLHCVCFFFGAALDKQIHNQHWKPDRVPKALAPPTTVVDPLDLHSPYAQSLALFKYHTASRLVFWKPQHIAWSWDGGNAASKNWLFGFFSNNDNIAAWHPPTDSTIF